MFIIKLSKVRKDLIDKTSFFINYAFATNRKCKLQIKHVEYCL